MKELIEITWASATLDEARKVSRFLVQEKLVACSQIIPWIESIYMWDENIETAQESRVVFKTRKECLPKICDTIKKNTRYEIPEILWRPINDEGNLGGLDTYLKWIDESTLKG